jgi:hypothetical protein
MNNEDSAEGTKDRTATQGSEQILNRAHDAAESLASSAHEQLEAVKERAETGRDHAAERIRRVGTALRGVGESLREQDDTFVANYADSISNGIERVATYVGSMEPGSLVGDANRLARSKPVWFFGGAFVVGLAAGRFLRSSGPESVAARSERPRPPPRYSAGVPQGRHSGIESRRIEDDISTRGVFDIDERARP